MIFAIKLLLSIQRTSYWINYSDSDSGSPDKIDHFKDGKK